VAESNDNLIGFIASTVETISDRLNGIEERMATKADTNRLEVGMTSIRGDIEQVQLRLDGIEHKIASRFEHVEGELSRLRSAVYILGKDRPEILRLLGHAGA
jgi:tetrahydromethanopterin S-methyltransferase subunit G